MTQTEFVQSLFDRAASNPGTLLMLPNGPTVLERTITAKGLYGCIFHGDTETVLTWAGPPGAPMFDLPNMKETRFGHFAVNAFSAKPVDAVFRLSNQGGAPDPGFNTWRRVNVDGVDGGVLAFAEYAGPTDANMDFDVYEECTAANYRVAGWLNPLTQSMAHVYRQCKATAYQGGGKFAIGGTRDGNQGSRAGFRWEGGFCANNQTDFYINGANDHIVIDGLNSENSSQFLRTDGPSGAALGLVMRSIRWANNNAAPGIPFLDIRYPGSILLQDSVQLGGDASKPMSINWTAFPGAMGPSFTIERCRFVAKEMDFTGMMPGVVDCWLSDNTTAKRLKAGPDA